MASHPKVSFHPFGSVAAHPNGHFIILDVGNPSQFVMRVVVGDTLFTKGTLAQHGFVSRSKFTMKKNFL
eukprot:3075481-Amphidinium_carterae.1